jgi:endonuclease/exonuclease/phosphatase family metal-dependent hydrolase
LCALAALVLGGLAGGCGESPQPLSVMTRNLYLGADLAPLLGALTPQDMEALAGTVWRNARDSNFPERAGPLAEEIVTNAPDVVCLQEVSLYRTQSPGNWMSDAAPDAVDVQLDFLALLQEQLRARGAMYEAVTIGTNGDEEMPALDDAGAHIDVRLTDRDVILVRDGVTAVAGPGGRFPTALMAPIGGAGGTTLTFHRGWISVDVTVGGKKVRVYDSHLEVGALQGRTQEQQARELMEAIGPHPGSAILAGDFNSPADGGGTQSYALLTTASGLATPFRDTFPFRQHKLADDMQSGSPPLQFTCCIDLAAAAAIPAERIDLILFRDHAYPVDTAVIVPRKTPAGLWPSDHLGVIAQLQLR